MKSNSAGILKGLIINLVLVFAVMLSAGTALAEGISEAEILKAQQEWADGIVAIGKAYTDKQDYKKIAQDMINDLYAFQATKVLFKPTKVADIQFRPTKEGTLSYFIGNNKDFPEDKGFALQPWIKVKITNSGGMYIKNEIALAMGVYSFTTSNGEIVDVDFSFGYIKNEQGKIKIILQHSSLPYSHK